MHGSKRGSWWGLYALAALTVGLLYAAARVHVGEVLHKVLYVAIILVVTTLAWLWSETHANLLGAEGVNAQAEKAALAATGVEAGRYAPSRTATQAHFRSIMLAGESNASPADPGPGPHAM
jgi:hypothetical protein